jgi:hypothetical protein
MPWNVRTLSTMNLARSASVTEPQKTGTQRVTIERTLLRDLLSFDGLTSKM